MRIWDENMLFEILNFMEDIIYLALIQKISFGWPLFIWLTWIWFDVLWQFIRASLVERYAFPNLTQALHSSVISHANIAWTVISQ